VRYQQHNVAGKLARVVRRALVIALDAQPRVVRAAAVLAVETVGTMHAQVIEAVFKRRHGPGVGKTTAGDYGVGAAPHVFEGTLLAIRANRGVLDRHKNVEGRAGGTRAE